VRCIAPNLISAFGTTQPAQEMFPSHSTAKDEAKESVVRRCMGKKGGEKKEKRGQRKRKK